MNHVRSLRKALIISVFLFILAPGINGQERIIRGLVVTYDSIPVIQARIKVKSSREKFRTDSMGRFEIICEPEDKIILNARGFHRKAVNVTVNDTFLKIDLKLKKGEHSLELATGPGGHIKGVDRERLGTINNDEVDFSKYSNIYDALRGYVTGVNIVGDMVYIRGQTNIISGDDEALFVVDGTIVSKSVFSNIPTSDIRNIKILKGSAASVYGSRGANGVVEVYTKRGR